MNHDYTKPDSNGADILTEAHNLITGPRLHIQQGVEL